MHKFARIWSALILLSLCSLVASAQNAGQSNGAPPPSTPPPPTLAPSPSLAKDSRCYELRTYHAAPGKLEALHARFRNHTMKLFKKHKIEVVGFWGPTDKEAGSENELVYLLVFPSRAARDQAFDNFRADPEWIAVRTESEKNGKLTDKIDSLFLMASDYSPVK
ncbi:MAG TPA: NIPSNAP family protein [Blastocatellia bacterium]|nr:NIPSNAP family protein [Blastocatellia bacterium]